MRGKGKVDILSVVHIAKAAGEKLFEWLVQPFIDLWDFVDDVFDGIKQGIKDLVGFLPGWAQKQLGLTTTIESKGFSPETMKQSIDSKSETDVTIRVESENGTIATVEQVKSKGTSKPKVVNSGLLGPVPVGI